MAEQISITGRIAQDVAQGDNSLPVYAPVAAEIRDALAAASDTAKLESLLIKDPALAGEILHAANSAFFSGLAKVSTVHKAVERLGAQQVRNLALAAVDTRSYRSSHTEFTELMTWIWQQSTAAAVGCRWCAKKSSANIPPDEAFFAGLLHHVGRLLVLKSLTTLYEGDTTWDLTPGLINELLRSLDSDMGYQLMCRWELPERYAEIARDHNKQIIDGADPMLLIVRLVNKTCAKLGIGLPPEPNAELDNQTECRLLGLKPIHAAELEVVLEDLTLSWN